MSDLISRSELLKRFLVSKDGHRIPERDCDNFEVTVSIKNVKTIIKEQPTAYDPDKVVEGLEAKENEAILKAPNTSDITNPEYQKWMMKSYGFKEAIEIIKQGGVSKNCNNCANYTEPDEVDNGCYLCCKGYENNYKPKADNDGASDDVCEWRIVDRPHNLPIYNTSCGKIRLQ